MTVTNFIYNFDKPDTWINKGSYWQRVIRYYDGAISPSTPYDFTGNGWSNPRLQVRRYQNTTSELYVAGTESGLSVTLNSTGDLTMTMTSACNGSFVWTDGYLQVEATMPDGTNEFRLLYGKIHAEDEVIP